LVSSSLAVLYDEFSLGGDLQYEVKERKTEDPIFKNFNFGATYKSSNLIFAANVVDKLKRADFGIVHSYSGNTKLGFEFTHELGKKAVPFVVQAGVSHTLDDVSNIKAKLLSSGLISFAYQVKVKKGLTTTVSLETSAKEVSGGKIGFELCFEPLD